MRQGEGTEEKSTCQNYSGEKFHETKINCKSFKSNDKISYSNKSNEKPYDG